VKTGQRTFLTATPEQWALLAALPLNQAGNTALFTVLGQFRDAFGLDYSELGIVLAAYGFARLIANVPTGFLIRKAPLRATIILGTAVNVGAAAAAMASIEVWQVVASRAIQGMSASVVQAAILAWLVIGAGSANRGRVMALSEALFGAVGLVVPLSTGALAILLSWRAAFAMATIAGGLACLFMLLGTSAASAPSVTNTSRDAPPAATRSWRGISVGGSTLIAAYLLTFVVAFGRNGMLNTLLPVIGSDEIGLTPLQVGLGLTLANLTGIGVLMLGGWAGDRVGRRRLAVPGLVVLVLCQSALFAVHGQLLYFIIVAAQGVGYFINSFPTSLIGDALPAHLRSVGIAGYRIMVDGAILAAPVMVGFATDWRGFGAAKALTLGISVAILLGVWLATRGPAVKPAPAAPAVLPRSLPEGSEPG
jgi:MFS transporter, DHA1 family, multidrug resistance protein